MTKDEIVNFIAKNSIPGAISWGDYKKLLILEQLLLGKLTNIPIDRETLVIYTKLNEKDLKPQLDKFIADGIISETSHHLFEDKILTLNIEES